MPSEIRKIQTIKNLAVFQDFEWDDSVRGKGNNIVDFKEINILYGRNYSGKTTISRIFRALETGSISDKYSNPEFSLLIEGNTTITQDQLSDHDHTVRVFNEDFIRENLRFISDDKESINSFAILGKDNTKYELEIKNLEAELGSEEKNTGLRYKLSLANEALRKAQQSTKSQEDSLQKKLKDEANGSPADYIKGIKDQPYGDSRYNITRLKSDLDEVLSENYQLLSSEDALTKGALLKEEAKDDISEWAKLDLKLEAIKTKGKELLERRIQNKDRIQELVNDSILEEWVRKGREHHHSKRESCAFCGSDLPADLWDKLDIHFNKESDDLRKELEQTITSIQIESERVNLLLTVQPSQFYVEFEIKATAIQSELKTELESYFTELEGLEKQLGQRIKNLFKPDVYIAPSFDEAILEGIHEHYDELRIASNNYTPLLEQKKEAAKKALRLNHVYSFAKSIGYSDLCNQIDILKAEEEKAVAGQEQINDEVQGKQKSIGERKSKMKDEGEGANKVNDYLNHYFGHNSLHLKPIKNFEPNATAKYRFEVQRNDQKAHHLSEGECSLLAFCYFMAKLDDHETRGSKPIIWIDDPISSLDGNHIFFIYSLINAKIVKEKKYKQLFISTHNLEFLKCLKKLSNDYRGKSEKKVKIREFFLIERHGETGQIKVMPEYMKRYATEFNHLFGQVYKCATIEEITDENYQTFYNFGNNARKFLEIYLYYKFPNGKENDEKLKSFFDCEDLSTYFIERVNNEYSHLCGLFERGDSPIDTPIPEMQKVAQKILDKVKEEDKNQYDSLVESVSS